MMPLLDFWVPGHAKTKGSLEPRAPKCHCCTACRGYARMPQLRDTPGSKRWRGLVAYAATQAMRRAPRAWPLKGPVEMALVYRLAVTEEELIEQGAGDIDKLERNIFDALQDAGVYANDAQVVRCAHEKVAVVDFGVRIMVAMVGEG